MPIQELRKLSETGVWEILFPSYAQLLRNEV